MRLVSWIEGPSSKAGFWGLERRHDLGTGSDVRRELVPAAHGLELRCVYHVGAGDFVDRGVDAGRVRGAVAAPGGADRSGGNVTFAAEHARASQRIGEVHGIVPEVPLGLLCENYNPAIIILSIESIPR